MSEFIEDSGKTSDNPQDYNKRDFTPQGCIGSIACKECGAILWAKGAHCFCMGIYECPRCGHKESGIPIGTGIKDNGWRIVVNGSITDLQNLTSKFATLLGNTENLFGMELAGNAWTDGASADDSYYPKHKKLSDFSEEECIETLNHIHNWLQEGK